MNFVKIFYERVVLYLFLSIPVLCDSVLSIEEHEPTEIELKQELVSQENIPEKNSEEKIDMTELLKKNPAPSEGKSGHFFERGCTLAQTALEQCCNVSSNFLLLVGSLTPLLVPLDPRYSSSYSSSPFLWLAPVALTISTGLAIKACLVTVKGRLKVE